MIKKFILNELLERANRGNTEQDVVQVGLIDGEEIVVHRTLLSSWLITAFDGIGSLPVTGTMVEAAYRTPATAEGDARIAIQAMLESAINAGDSDDHL